tara:strand:- start:852 stop:3737 length:2886 start_codon:yes stop_codon:yes gene_type:complete
MTQFKNSAILAPTKTANSPVEQCWRNGQTPLTASDHYYLQVMGIDPRHLDLRINDEGMLLVPMRKDDSSALANVMLIGQDGTSIQLANGSVTNACYSTIRGRDDGRIFCIGFASAYALWCATGRTVIVCWAPEQLQTVVRSLSLRPGDCVAVDPIYTESLTSELPGFKQSRSTAVRNAMETGLPFYLSRPGLNFHAMEVEKIQNIFSQAPVSEVPVFDVHELEFIDLTVKGSETWLNTLSEFTDPKQAASQASSIALRLLHNIPVKMNLGDLRQKLETAIVKPVIHPSTMDNILQYLEKKLHIRREIALAPVSLPGNAAITHSYELHPAGLPTIADDEWHGGIIIIGPTGAGKTQNIGQPLARHSMASNNRFVAICHRVSLTTELANRLELDCYTDYPAHDKDLSLGLAVCLPSITKPKFQAFVDATTTVFIDEVSQVLRFLESDDYCCTPWATNQQVYERLRALVQKASCVVVADANIDARTMEFLESCRPGEKFRIIEVPAPENAGIVAEYHYRKDSEGYIAGHGLAELSLGGRIWIAVEAAKSTERLEKIFQKAGYRTLAIHADNKNNRAQRRFLSNVEAESLHYDVIIASPIISSGVSIEHKNAHEARFTLGLYVGGGFTTTPAEAIQQMRRVRYLDRWVIGIRPPRGHHGKPLSAEQQLSAATTASKIEGSSAKPTAFDQFVAEIRSEKTEACSDFAGGLIWQLDAAGWTLHQKVSNATPVDTNKVAQEIEARYEATLMRAPIISVNAAKALKLKHDRTEAENLILEAHNLRTEFGLGAVPLTSELIRLWDRGRGIDQIDFFNYFRGIVPQHITSSRSIISGDYPITTATLLQWIFSDIDLVKGVNNHSAKSVIEKVWMKKELCTFLEIANPMPRKRRDGIKEINSILARAGLKMTFKTERKPDDTSKPREPGTKGNPQTRVYRLSRDLYEPLTKVADRRNDLRKTLRLESFPPLS